VGCRSEELFKERLGDRDATGVDRTGLAELLERSRAVLVAGMGQAGGAIGEADADAAVVAARRPVHSSLVRHALLGSSGSFQAMEDWARVGMGANRLSAAAGCRFRRSQPSAIGGYRQTGTMSTRPAEPLSQAAAGRATLRLVTRA
jgi:hypothetical protein